VITVYVKSCEASYHDIILPTDITTTKPVPIDLVGDLVSEDGDGSSTYREFSEGEGSDNTK
jgi:hypothetical protein